MKKLISILILVLAITSCHKQPKILEAVPVANFTTDKETYTAGDVIHLKSNSTNAYTYKWTMPDGSIQTTQNIDYVTDSDDVTGSKTFILEVTSKSGIKSKAFSKKYTLMEYILESDYFFDGTATRKPTHKGCNAKGTNWNIGADNLSIILFGNTPPTQSGIYTIKPYFSTLANGEAAIGIFKVISNDESEKILANSGQLIIQITNTGKVRAIFNNINATPNHTPGGILPDVTISGNITCH